MTGSKETELSISIILFNLLTVLTLCKLYDFYFQNVEEIKTEIDNHKIDTEAKFVEIKEIVEQSNVDLGK